MASRRTERVGELIRETLAQRISELSDPRFELVTITSVRISPDLKNARILWSHPRVGTDAKATRDMQRSLEGASGLLRRTIAERCDLRVVPDLTFFFDDSPMKAERIETLLRSIAGTK